MCQGCQGGGSFHLALSDMQKARGPASWPVHRAIACGIPWAQRVPEEAPMTHSSPKESSEMESLEQPAQPVLCAQGCGFFS